MAENTPAPKPEADFPPLIKGVERAIFRDVYHRFLRMRWDAALLSLMGAVLAINTVFALGYMTVDGVANMEHGSFHDAFFFSVQTLATIGYGAMYPTSDGAHVLVTIEAVVGILVSALATGLVFAKFTVSTARITFSRHATIAPMNGVPTFMFRVGNQRDSRIIEAVIRVVGIRTEHPLEGGVFYRMFDIPLSRERSPAVSRSWTALHTIDEKSPLYGLTPEDFVRDELEFLVTLVGIDDTSLQPVHASHTYAVQHVLWGMRPADILSETERGRFVVDLTRFHDIEPSLPTEAFPYPREQRPAAVREADPVRRITSSGAEPDP